MGFWDINRPDMILITKKWRIYQQVDFIIPVKPKGNMRKKSKRLTNRTLPENWQSCETWDWQGQ